MILKGLKWIRIYERLLIQILKKKASKKYFDLSQQRAEILFNAERLLSESARGVLKERPAGDDDWVEVPTNEEPLQQETFTVNLGNQLKITQNLR